MFSGGCIIVRAKIFCCGVLVCDSGPKSESAKFYRLQLRPRLQPKQSTPTDCNSGLDSDSATLLLGPKP